MKKFLGMLGLLLAMSMSSVAHADKGNGFGIGPYGGYLLSGLPKTWLAGLRMQYSKGAVQFGFEGTYMTPKQTILATEIKYTMMRAALFVHFILPTGTIRPYAGGGGGLYYYKLATGAVETDYLMDLAFFGRAGLQFQLGSRVALFAEGQYEFILMDGGSIKPITVQGGLMFQF